ncbi:MAG TPA: choice-of-anchor Q domain-containing protein, partial [Thermomicrobiales bacterium]
SVGVLGGGLSIGSGSITLGNTIVAGNTTANSSPDVDGPIISLGHNLIGTIAGSSGWVASDKTGGPGGATNPPNLLAPRLNPLGSNGGTTQTRLPLPGSPALDAGDDAMCNQTGPGTVNKLDQRGFPRPIGSHCDIGATEGTGGLIVPVAGTTPQQAPVGAAFVPALAATVENPGGAHLGGGISVTFTVSSVGGAGGSFPGNATTATAVTDVNGVATAPTFTANASTGAYTVTANLTAGPLGAPATFALTNTAAILTGITLAAPGGVASPSVKVGQTMQLTATGAFSDGSMHPLTGATWVSSNPQIVAVDTAGKITVLSQGAPVTITATVNGVPGQIIVVIGAPTFTGVGGSPAPAGRPSGATSGPSGGPAANPIPASR